MIIETRPLVYQDRNDTAICLKVVVGRFNLLDVSSHDDDESSPSNGSNSVVFGSDQKLRLHLSVLTNVRVKEWDQMRKMVQGLDNFLSVKK